MRRAFTLIELLIVIAIIAILALIAVPNFLEAQMRAKVTRVYADMRTCAVALEMYTVDWGRSIIGYNEGRGQYGLWDKKRAWWAWNAVTTPVAYLGSVPEDPFLPTKMEGASDAREEYRRFTYNTATPQSTLGRAGHTWQMYSPGPSKWAGPDWLYTMIGQRQNTNVYDATNGTISTGMIWWTNKGNFDGSNL